MSLREITVVNNKDMFNGVFVSRNYRSDSCPWKFDVLKTSIFAPSLLGQIYILGTSDFRGATITLLFHYSSPLNLL